MEFSIYRQAFREIEPVVNLGYQEDLRHACQKNLALAESLLLVGAVPEKDLAATAFGIRGFEPYCPSGGRYVLDAKYNRASCSVHGTAFRPRQPRGSKDGETAIKLANSFKRINARLSFSPEGLMTTVEIQRNR
jgi:hypothetical protein